MAGFQTGVERDLDQILANQQWMKSALLTLNMKVNILMAQTDQLEAAVAQLETQADQTVAAIEALTAQVASGGVSQEQVDALTARITAVTDKLANAGKTAVGTLAKAKTGKK